MGITKIKFTLTHPDGLALIRLRINYKEIPRDEIYAFQTATTPNIIVEGEIELNIVSAKVNIEWEAVGQPHFAGTIVLKYKDKSLLKEDEDEILLDTDGRASKTLIGISLI